MGLGGVEKIGFLGEEGNEGCERIWLFLIAAVETGITAIGLRRRYYGDFRPFLPCLVSGDAICGKSDGFVLLSGK